MFQGACGLQTASPRTSTICTPAGTSLCSSPECLRADSLGEGSCTTCSYLGHPADLKIPAAEVNVTDACSVRNYSRGKVGSSGMIFFVKRYTDDSIILAGCGGDEYGYYRDGPFIERII